MADVVSGVFVRCGQIVNCNVISITFAFEIGNQAMKCRRKTFALVSHLLLCVRIVSREVLCIVYSIVHFGRRMRMKNRNNSIYYVTCYWFRATDSVRVASYRLTPPNTINLYYTKKKERWVGVSFVWARLYICAIANINSISSFAQLVENDCRVRSKALLLSQHFK